MIDVEKQVKYWRDSAAEDWEVAQQLIRSDKIPHGLFFAHLALEKALKALVCRETRELPPKIHNLLTLARCAKLSLSSQQKVILGRMNRFQLEGRYIQPNDVRPTTQEAEEYMHQIKELYEWLETQ